MVIRSYDKIKAMKRKAQKKEKYKKTTILLPYHLWEELRIESIKKGIPMGELIAQKLQRLKALIEKTAMTESPLDY
jgi:uncharacterized Fe-S cluster-containing radical SAM superfamily enzyme